MSLWEKNQQISVSKKKKCWRRKAHINLHPEITSINTWFVSFLIHASICAYISFDRIYLKIIAPYFDFWLSCVLLLSICGFKAPHNWILDLFFSNLRGLIQQLKPLTLLPCFPLAISFCFSLLPNELFPSLSLFPVLYFFIQLVCALLVITFYF